MNLIELMKKRYQEIEVIKEKLFDLQHDLIGAEVEYESKEAIIMEVDWREKAILLNYDDVNMEWVSF